MIERYGVQGSVIAGVFFTESVIAGAEVVAPVRKVVSQESVSLQALQFKMAHDAIQMGGVAIMNFRYIRRKHNWFRVFVVFLRGKESLFGEGEVVRIR